MVFCSLSGGQKAQFICPESPLCFKRLLLPFSATRESALLLKVSPDQIYLSLHFFSQLFLDSCLIDQLRWEREDLGDGHLQNSTNLCPHDVGLCICERKRRVSVHSYGAISKNYPKKSKAWSDIYSEQTFVKQERQAFFNIFKKNERIKN